MAILIDDSKIYNIYTEGKFKNLSTATAMGAASVFGSVNNTMADTTYNSAYSSENMSVLRPETIVPLWSKYYQTSKCSEKEQRARKAIENEVSNVPADAMNAINVAVYIFGWDEGVSPNVLNDLLVLTGQIEGGYKYKRQITKWKDGEPIQDGDARGYWQVEPKTAMDALINSRAYFGPKFQRHFGPEAQKLLSLPRVNNKQNQEIVADMIMTNDDLAAAFAAVKWISSTKDDRILRNIRN